MMIKLFGAKSKGPVSLEPPAQLHPRKLTKGSINRIMDAAEKRERKKQRNKDQRKGFLYHD